MSTPPVPLTDLPLGNASWLLGPWDARPRLLPGVRVWKRYWLPRVAAHAAGAYKRLPALTVADYGRGRLAIRVTATAVLPPWTVGWRHDTDLRLDPTADFDRNLGLAKMQADLYVTAMFLPEGASQWKHRDGELVDIASLDVGYRLAAANGAHDEASPTFHRRIDDFLASFTSTDGIDAWGLCPTETVP